MSLIEAQRNFAERKLSSDAPKVSLNYAKDSQWRPVDLERDNVEESDHETDYGLTYPKPSTRLYYWKDTYWRK